MGNMTSEASSKGAEIFLKLLVIAIGIVLGVVVSFIIALFAGWVEFEC